MTYKEQKVEVSRPVWWLICLVSLLVGAIFVTQAAVNVGIGRVLGHPLRASWFNFVTAFVVLLPFIFIFGPSLKEIKSQYAKMDEFHWWWFTSGVGAYYFVTMNIYISPKITFSVYFIILLIGQMSMSLLFDHFGAFGFVQRKANIGKFFGIGLAILGAALLTEVEEDFQTIDILYYFLALLAGIIIPFEAAFDRLAADFFMHPVRGAAWNFFTGTIIGFIAFGFSFTAVPLQFDKSELHFYNWLGGLGALSTVFSWIYLPRIVGFSLYFILFNVGQLTTSLIFDTIGFPPGDDKVPISAQRIAGVVIAILSTGVFMFFQEKQKREMEASTDQKLLDTDDDPEVAGFTREQRNSIHMKTSVAED